MLAIWQVLQPDLWFANNDPNLKQDLLPFKDEQGDYYTSDTVQDWTKFYYDYDDLQRTSPNETDAQRVARIQAFIASTYNQTAAVLTSPATQELVAPAQPESAPVPATEDSSQHIMTSDASKEYPDYLLNIIYDR
jgi:predicted ATP-dependent endonuclease of OLD family